MVCASAVSFLNGKIFTIQEPSIIIIIIAVTRVLVLMLLVLAWQLLAIGGVTAGVGIAMCKVCVLQ